MIDITILPLALLAMRKQEPVERTEWKPSARDAQELRENLAKFEKKEINGRMQYPYELFLQSKNVISFDKFGMIQVINPLEYHRMNKIDSLRQYIDESEMEKMFELYPEAREEYADKIRAMKDSVRGILKLKTA